MRLACLSFVVSAALALGGPPAIAAGYPLNVASITPAPGQLTSMNIPIYGTGSQEIEVVIPDRPGLTTGLTVEIASANVAGQDGTLADDYRVAGTYGGLTPRDSNPAAYRGSVSSSAWSNPGTYYLQLSARGYYPSCPGGPTESSCIYISPVYTYTVVSPAPPAAPAPTAPAGTSGVSSTPEAIPSPFLSLSETRSTIRRIIRSRARRQPQNLKYGCSREDDATFTCNSSWYDSRNLWALTFYISADNEDVVSWNASGLKASRSCVKRRSVRRCARRVSW